MVSSLTASSLTVVSASLSVVAVVVAVVSVAFSSARKRAPPDG